MNSVPFQDCVAIDTNVFLHLLYCDRNPDQHINRLLAYLQLQDIRLISDNKGRIAGEYLHQIGPRISQSDDMRNEIQLLRYWILYAKRLETPLDLSDQLMITIRQTIVEPTEHVDRIFVYVAFKKGKILISNDKMNIVVGPPKEQGRFARRHRLLRDTKKLCPNGADILTSQEAHDKCPKQP